MNIAAAMEKLPVLRTMGISVFDPIWARRRHRDSSAELLCVVRGRLTVAIEQKQIKMDSGDFTFIAPDTPHYDLFNPTDSPEIFLIQYRWDAHAEFFRRVNDAGLSSLPRPVHNEVLRTILQLREHSRDPVSPVRQTLNRSLLHTLLLRLWSFSVIASGSMEVNRKKQANRQQQLMEHAKQYIDSHYHEPQSLTRLAARLQVSSCHLSRVFSRESGFSLTEYLTSVRMFKARVLLRNRNGNVSEVAQAVGYTNNAYFSRLYKKHFGIPPSSALREPPPGRG